MILLSNLYRAGGAAAAALALLRAAAGRTAGQQRDPDGRLPGAAGREQGDRLVRRRVLAGLLRRRDLRDGVSRRARSPTSISARTSPASSWAA